MESLLNVRKVDRATENLPEIFRLYKAAFPLKERVDLNVYLDDTAGGLDILSFWEDDLFCGFAVFFTHKDLTQIFYFAIEEDLRRQGYGGRALRSMQAYYKGKRILADLEDPVPGAPNPEERLRRIAFYERNGFALSDVHIRWEDEDYVMMVSGGTLTALEFDEFLAGYEEGRGPGAERMDTE